MLTGFWRGHELADGIEYDLELGIVLLLQRRQLAGKIGKGGEHLPQSNEGPHDLDVDTDGRALCSTLESMATPCLVKA
jgi:hypothetical protein